MVRTPKRINGLLVAGVGSVALDVHVDHPPSMVAVRTAHPTFIYHLCWVRYAHQTVLIAFCDGDGFGGAKRPC